MWAPQANAIAERFAGTLRRELLDRLLIINQRHAATVLRQYERHYNEHRPHRALGQAAPPRPLHRRTPTAVDNVRRCDRLGGLIHEYQHVAQGVQIFWHPQARAVAATVAAPTGRVRRHVCRAAPYYGARSVRCPERFCRQVSG